jgi:DNA-directed RNA polymerase alpha subunit
MRWATEGEEMTKTPGEFEPPKPITKAEREGRKAFRQVDAEKAMTEHEIAQRAFYSNRERLKAERLARETAVGPMIAPTPELPDDTPIECVRFPTRIQNGLAAAALKTVGEVRETSDEILLSFQNFGHSSVAQLRETLGLPSADGVRQLGKKPA